MAYRCPDCGYSLMAWLVKLEQFECPDCKQRLTSNSRRQFRRAIYFSCFCWLLFLSAMRYYTGSWGYAAVVSIEAGGILAVMCGALFYRLTLCVTEVE
ncbi:MAG: hypothetical protein L3J28_06715 [Candidatus Polarisedimenticolaceae bacterium]|nr:hypothetical protein [Candidatus Polarisedimenticolaceae bacterium]